MSEPAIHEIANVLAAVISAAGGCAGAIAAFRSAGSAREAMRSAEESSRRASLREVSATASTILLEASRLSLRAHELDTEYQTATVFSGSAVHSGYEELRSNAREPVAKSVAFADDAALFTGGANSLAQSSASDIDRVLMRLTEHLSVVRAMRDELDRKHAAVSAANAEERGRRLPEKYAK